MGGKPSSFSKNVVGNETHKSARNVLEKIGLEIYKEIEKTIPHKDQLIGTLSRAQFLDGLHKAADGGIKHGPEDSCGINHLFHTNITNQHERNPCHGRKENRFDENAESYCNSDKIRGNENKRNDGTACVPFRRQNMCDKNLEYLINKNTKTTHDLLGNVLVTAKYEGESIVKKHPNRGSSEVCTALVRSFADIGDIVRGRDMFKPNPQDKVQEGLKNVFKNIHENFPEPLKRHYADHDKSGNYYKLREDWWTANRDQVWKALTCSADDSEDYFIQSEGAAKSFSNSKCGHGEHEVLTNLDYVPQFLRWFNEWAEEFCRIRNDKLKKVKKECRGENIGDKYCSREGYDCNKTNIKRNEIFVDLDCPRCEEECMKYKKWMEKRQEEFNKQKRQYENEIKKFSSKNYDKYYEKFSKKYTPFDSFVETLKKGAYCTNGNIDGKIDFNKQYDTFSHSQYCKSCPIFNLKCANGKCNSLDDISCPNIPTMSNISTYKNGSPTDIYILVNDSNKRELSTELKDDFKECDIFKKLGQQKWNCKYKCNLHVCEQKNFEYGIDDEKHMLIEVLIKRWLKYFLNDYSQIKEKLKQCINNEEKKISCIRGCYKKCDCVEKWIEEKGKEWENIKDRYIKQHVSKDEDVSSKLKTFLQQGLFPEYIKNALNNGERLDSMKESSGCKESSKSNGKSCENNDVIKILLNRLEDKITTCKTQHDESRNKDSCNTSPKPLPRRRHHHRRRRGVRSVRIRRRPPPPPPPEGLGRSLPNEPRGPEEQEEDDEEEEAASEDSIQDTEQEGEETAKKEEGTTQDTVDVCEMVKALIGRNDGTQAIEHCNPKTKGEYPQWQCGINSSLVAEDGACMPPRRQKLCVINLQYLSETATETELRKAFIECAAIETFWLWHKYKTDNNGGTEAQQKLNSGTIPEEFKRQMFYTFADFRDFLFGTDISKNHGEKSNLKKQIDSLFPPNSGGKHPNGKTREQWWNENGPKIWEAMLCALEKIAGNKDKLTGHQSKYQYNSVTFTEDPNITPLSTFAETPQFFRWLTEWGEDFCKKRGEKVNELVQGCEKCTLGTDGKICEKNSEGCTKCRNECTKYQTWLKDWKQHYDKQKDKFKIDKENDQDAKTSEHAYEYLKKQLEKICKSDSTNGDCEYNCMKNISTKEQPTENKSPVGNTDSMPASLEYPPKEINGKCDCKVTHRPQPPLAPPPPPPSRPQGESKHDHRGRNEPGGQGQRPARPSPPPDPRQSLARSATDHQPPHAATAATDNQDDLDEDDEDDDEVEEEEEEEEEEEGEAGEVAENDEEQPPANGEGEKKEEKQEVVDGDKGEKVPKDKVNPCQIVKTLFSNPKQFKDVACNQKYGPKAPTSWKCVTPSGDNTRGSDSSHPSRQRREAASVKTSDSNQGAICVPPRRRKLYIGRLTQWAEKYNTDKSPGSDGATSTSDQTTSQNDGKPAAQPNSRPTQASTSSSSNPRDDDLVKAFVESAAIETFFWWHRYKEQWKAQKKAEQRLTGGLPGTGGTLTLDSLHSDTLDPNDPGNLYSGVIPPDFLRQMFYTLGDYRDILFSGVKGEKNGYSDIFSGDKVIQEREEKIKDTIQTFFQNGGSNQAISGAKDPSQPGDKRTALWGDFAQYIWNGMIYALTYNTDTASGQTPEQDPKVKDALWDDTKKKPKSDKYNYTYENVVLKEDNENGGPRSGSSPIPSGDNTPPKLSDFVKLPPFFRWLHEWGNSFCFERAKRLAQIKHECMDGDSQKYSGDGEACDRTNTTNGVFDDLESSSCATPCRLYKRWIEKKGKEYDKQEKIYVQQKSNYENEHNGAKHNKDDNEFYTRLQSLSDAAEFLHYLASCKKDSGKGNGKDILDFSQPDKTFKEAENCKPCSEFTVKLEKCNCREPAKGNTCTTGKITAENFKDKIDCKDVFMRVSDSNKTGFDDLKDCENAHIFKGFREDVWKCGKICGLDVCKLENVIGNQNQNQIILIRALFKRWVENFLKDYNEIKRKISHCINNGNGSICTSDCGKKCKCVGQWIEKKRGEWDKIKKHYVGENKSEDYDSDNLNSFLETLITQIAAANVQKKLIKLSKFDNSCGCSADANEQNKNGYQDAIECMLEKLKDKIEQCKKKPSGSKQCTTPPTTLDDDEEPLEEDEQNTVGKEKVGNKAPAFCPAPVPKKEKSACEIVNIHFSTYKHGNGENGINECNKKEGDFNWNCSSSQFKNNEEGPCMPPRRQKLCINDLKVLKDQSSTNTEDLREAFINCASKETFFLWKKYKEDKQKEKDAKSQNDEVQKQLNEGTIPDDFKRQMFYTLGDYRDLCLGNDLGKHEDTTGISDTVTRILKKEKKGSQTISPETWWNEIKEDVWQGMLCGLSHHIGDDEKKGEKLSKSEAYQYSKLKDELEDFAKTPQFLRWFIEWSDDFCNQKKKQFAKLKEGCNGYTCGDIGHTKDKCEKACEVYKTFIQEWRKNYDNQSAKFKKDKDSKTYDNFPGVKEHIHNANHAHEYLHKQLQELCENKNCDCMEEHSTKEQETKSSEQKDLPEAFDYPPNEFQNNCWCKKEEAPTKRSIPRENGEPGNCVESAAYMTQKELFKFNNTSFLKVNSSKFNHSCKKIDKDNRLNNHCKFDDIYSNSVTSLYSKCTNDGNDRFDINKIWNCIYIKHLGRYICIPPRRKNMCIDEVINIKSYNVTDSEKLLETIQNAAYSEGNDIIKNILKMEPCKEYLICDAMKYSFADLADIIKGTDILQNTKGRKLTQVKLHRIFTKIKDNLKGEDKKKYQDDTKHHKLRAAWWEANRKEVWKAMTCSAPNVAKLYKKGSRTTKALQGYCDHDNDPPYDDYIPQILRWMTEWSECYCRMLHKKIDDMKVYCDDCKWSSTNCSDDNEGTKCLKCKELCKQYTSLIKKWKPQFDIQEKIYKDLYMNTLTKKILKTTDNDYVKAFLDKLRVKHNRRSCMANNLGTYLRMTSQCEDVLFPERDSDKNKHEYAFNDYPDKYINQCVCKITNHPLDKCPFTNENKSSCDIMKEFSECKNKTFNNKLDNWGTHDLKHRTTINQGVLVPPRRTRLCLKPFIKNKYAENEEDIFFKDFITAAYTEAYVLRETFKNEPTETLQAMKYSFADYGDIIKGTDMIDNIYLNNLKTQLETILKYNGRTSNTKSTKDWWDNNKNKVWNAMLCGYKSQNESEMMDPNWCSLPEEDETDQFLRWFREWSEHFCARRNELYKQVESTCQIATCTSDDGTIRPEICKKNCEKYRNFIAQNRKQYEIQMYQYKKKYKIPQLNSKKDPDFVQNKCNGKCECLSNHIDDDKKWKEPYESFDDSSYKSKCDCQKAQPIKPAQEDKKPEDSFPTKPNDLPPLRPSQPSDNTSDILATTLPFGIAVALGSIAFLFLK
ncbi:hypothetical protein PFAG_00838, partial [Plasmodium falciparum Santa Lucia]